jgi:secreted trypsin-like serine protease
VDARDRQFNSRIDRAIVQAEKAAPTDDEIFLLLLRAAVASQPTDRRPALTVVPKQSNGPRLSNDPRYLSNVRALARQKRPERIVGGSAVKGRQFDDCVAVGDDDDFGCTGTLIAPNAVLTAAHCQALHSRGFVGNGLAQNGREFRVRRHIRHARFDGEYRHDLMILILQRPVTGVEPRRLAPTTLIDAASTARIVGFGTTDVYATQGFGTKRLTDVPIVSQRCRGKVNGTSDAARYGCHRNREIVAGKPLFLHDTCQGDSGGPLLVRDAKGRWLLAGVTSRGTDLGTNLCGDGGVYVRVDAYAAWIAAALKEA